MENDNKDALLPPRPGEKPVKKEIKGVAFVLYINGKPEEMSKTEALGLLAQISQLLLYFDQKEGEANG